MTRERWQAVQAALDAAGGDAAVAAAALGVRAKSMHTYRNLARRNGWLAASAAAAPVPEVVYDAAVRVAAGDAGEGREAAERLVLAWFDVVPATVTPAKLVAAARRVLLHAAENGVYRAGT